MGFRRFGKREVNNLEQCGCCPPSSPSFCVPIPVIQKPRRTGARRRQSAQPTNSTAVPPKIPSKIASPSNPIPSPSAAGSDGYGIINLDDLKKEVEKRCACKECVLKTYNTIHTDFILYANDRQNKNIQECLDIRGTRNNNYQKVVELLKSGKFDLNSYWCVLR